MSTYCDHFEPLFSDADDHFIGLKESQTGGGGSSGDGGYYKPSVAPDGTLSWTPSSASMPPVASQNIKGPTGATGPRGPAGETGPQGPKGEAGTGFSIKGYYPSLSALEAAVPAPETGAAYGVGTSDPYDIYVWDSDHRVWKNNGPLQGPPGETGPQGEKGDKGDTGAQGVKGEKGETGERGPAGPQGEKGDKGDTGAQGVKGDKGDTGERGPAGPQGDTGERGPAGSNGLNGVTFTPAVSSAGVLSWTNDGGKQNPQSVDLVAAVLAALPTWDGGSY